MGSSKLGIRFAWAAVLVFAAPCHGFAEEQDVRVYKKTDDRELKIDVAHPDGWRASDRSAALVFFYNGGWNAEGASKQFAEQAAYFARRGMVVARADYREKDKSGTTSAKCMEDIFSALRWVRANAAQLGIDPKRVAAGGGSGSAHLALSIFYADEIHAPHDDLSISPLPGALFLYNPDLDVIEPEMTQRIYEADEAAARRMPPTVIFSGTNDPSNPLMEDFVARARQRGLPVELFVGQDAPHGFFKFSPWLEKTTLRVDEALRSLGYLEEEPRVEPPSKPKPADYDEKMAQTMAKWQARHEALQKGRKLKPSERAQSQPVQSAPPASSDAPPSTDKATASPASAPSTTDSASLPKPSRDWDKDKDSKISKAEFKAPGPLFDNLDFDHDGFLSGAELAKLDSKLDLGRTDDAVWLVTPDKDYHGVEHKTYYSAAMKTEVGYNVYLPDEYPTSGKRYPVIYHLHGSGGNESSQVNLSEVYHKAITQKRMCPVIIVFANGGKHSYYCDGANGKVMAETTIVKELIPQIDRAYRTIPEKECRVIHGFSMGGFGALKLAFKRPDLFCAALSFGGGMASPNSVHLDFLRHIVGDDGRIIAENNPADLAVKNKDALRGMSIWLFTGTRDVAREDSTWAHEWLQSHGIPHRFEVSQDVGHAVNRHYDFFGGDIFQMLMKHFQDSKTFASQEKTD